MIYTLFIVTCIIIFSFIIVEFHTGGFLWKKLLYRNKVYFEEECHNCHYVKRNYISPELLFQDKNQQGPPCPKCQWISLVNYQTLVNKEVLFNQGIFDLWGSNSQYSFSDNPEYHFFTGFSFHTDAEFYLSKYL